MGKEIVLLLAEDDEGHATLTIQNLKRAGVTNSIVHFKDGQEILDFLFKRGNGLSRSDDELYALLLDIRMPIVDGLDVIRQIKDDSILKEIPVIILSTTDDPVMIERCLDLGCVKYVVKPLSYDRFTDEIRNLGKYLLEEIYPGLDAAGRQ
jgi:CheY-like chemotaxis protein